MSSRIDQVKKFLDDYSQVETSIAKADPRLSAIFQYATLSKSPSDPEGWDSLTWSKSPTDAETGDVKEAVKTFLSQSRVVIEQMLPEDRLKYLPIAQHLQGLLQEPQSPVAEAPSPSGEEVLHSESGTLAPDQPDMQNVKRRIESFCDSVSGPVIVENFGSWRDMIVGIGGLFTLAGAVTFVVGSVFAIASMAAFPPLLIAGAACLGVALIIAGAALTRKLVMEARTLEQYNAAQTLDDMARILPHLSYDAQAICMIDLGQEFRNKVREQYPGQYLARVCDSIDQCNLVINPSERPFQDNYVERFDEGAWRALKRGGDERGEAEYWVRRVAAAVIMGGEENRQLMIEDNL